MEGGSELVVRRINAGTKYRDFYSWPNEELDEMESTLAIQQYIQQKIRCDFTDIEGILELPMKVDVNVWNYEHLRQFCMQLNELCVMLQPVCNAETCSQMTATASWIFLCAVHKEPKECCAIDYIRHTLDGAASILNSNKYFPSRVNIKDSSVNKLPSTCRRVYRIFSHAYFHHKTIYDDFEGRTMLCHRFDRWVKKFDLITPDLLIVPLDDNSDNLSDNSDGDGYSTLINNSVIEAPNYKEEEADEGQYATVSEHSPQPNSTVEPDIDVEDEDSDEDEDTTIRE